MSEYSYVEKPFLDQLAALGWDVIDQGLGVPQDPAASGCSTFREIVLTQQFYDSVRSINTTEDGQTWITDHQLEELLGKITGQTGHSLLAANEAVQKLLYRTQVDKNEVTGVEYPNVKLIDFDHPERNHFVAINQFRIDTPGTAKKFIIPDIVLFVNGLPLVVVECKDQNDFTANPMHEAFKQLMRYSDQRQETHEAGLKEGEPRLFHTNQFVIRTNGDHAEFGSISATDEEYFFPWRDIHPEKYREYTPPLGNQRPQEMLIQGMLPKETLLDIMRTCTVFMDVGKNRIKIVSRYQQYRATCKIIERLRTGKTPENRSGVIWHTQGSGKSLTMVFVIRKLRMCDDLKDYKVCLINDRRSLEDQLTETAKLTGEKPTVINSTDDLREKLSSTSSNLNMVMVHKFHEGQGQPLPDYLDSVLDIPVFENFGVVNQSPRILLMIDEAHRTQSSNAAGSLSDNLFGAFPQATRLAFTGTPLIRVKGDQKTVDRFGDYIDKYKLQDAVADGTTVQILYEGKTAETAINERQAFDTEVDSLAAEHVRAQLRTNQNIRTLKKMASRDGRSFDDLVQERTAEEVAALKQKWGTSEDLLESEDRIKVIALDMVDHYIEQIMPNGFKAQVVCSSKLAAVRYREQIDQAIADRLTVEQKKPVWSAEMPESDRSKCQDAELCQRIDFLKAVVVISSDGTNEAAMITEARKHAREVGAVANFKKPFNYDDPDQANTGIAFLVVCDMLLTGFDAPIEQVMYIDKKVKYHNLLQTIARVNRVAKGKQRGYIVDYIGLANHLKEALSIYGGDDQKDIEKSLLDITVELPVLEDRYRRLLNLFKEAGVKDIEGFVKQVITDSKESYQILESAIVLMKDLRQRASFEVYLKQFMQSMDIILPRVEAHPYLIPVKRFGYIMHRVKERYKDDSLSISNAGEKVQKIIDEHLISLGINPKIPPVELMSDQFIQKLDENRFPKSKASEMEHAIRKHSKVHFEDDPAFYAKISEKLEAIIQKHKDNWDELCADLFSLRSDVQAGRKDDIEGVDDKAAPFYDLMGRLAFGESGFPPDHQEAGKQLVNDVMAELEKTINIINFWSNMPEVSKLRGRLADMLYLLNIHEVSVKADQIVTDITALAKRRHEDIVG